MRFIFNFIFFGLLFFIIWQYFPQAFETLVSWVTALFDFLRSVVLTILEKLGIRTNGNGEESEPVRQAFYLLMLRFR